MSADTSVESLEEPENHPLHNDVILGHLLSYVDTASSRDSSSTLMSMRRVCLKWNERAAPRLFNRLKVSMFTEGNLDSIKNFRLKHRTSEEYLHSVLKQAPRINLLQITDDYYCRLRRKSYKNDIWNNPQTWIQTYGNKLTGLTLAELKVEEHVLLSLLHNYTPNLETLTLGRVTLKEVPEGRASRLALRSIRSAAKTSKYLLPNLKNLEFIYYLLNFNNALKVLMEILMHANNLHSFTVHLYECRFRRMCVPLITAIVSKDKGILKNLKKLVFKRNIEPDLIPLLNQLELPNLTELDISISGKRGFGSLFETIGQQLEKLSLNLEILRGIREPGIFMPEMKNLKEFHLSYPTLAYCPRAYNARSVIHSMPALSVFSVFTDLKVKGYDECKDVRTLLRTDGDLLPVHLELKNLEISGAFKTPELVRVVTDAFVNLRYLSLWIHLGHLNEAFGHLATLEKLKRLEIHLSKPVEDFPLAVNTNMANFKNLKELILVKLEVPSLRKFIWVSNVHEAHAGFAKCNSLEILSLWNVKVDPTQLDQLRKELLKSKPKLAITHHSN